VVRAAGKALGRLSKALFQSQAYEIFIIDLKWTGHASANAHVIEIKLL